MTQTLDKEKKENMEDWINAGFLNNEFVLIGDVIYFLPCIH